ncbi:MAG: isoprenylcysteine carboxylmethyltransferase family protein [Armatimonadota bacterium]|nr:isoprenylcysteine carboxylmethyltransferase family protein [bacterium]
MLLLVARATPRSFLIGLPIVVFGMMIRVWSSGYLSKMERLVTAGPFAMGRNPLYIGSFFISLGYFVMCNQPVFWVLGPILFWLFHGGAIAYEEKLLEDKFGDDFREYCKSVPRIISFPHSLAGHGEFSLEQLKLNNEYRTIVGTVIAVGIFALLAYTPGHGMPICWLVSRIC